MLQQSQCNDEGLQIQSKCKQRQLELIQSYKHCRRRRKLTVSESKECKCWLREVWTIVRNVYHNAEIMKLRPATNRANALSISLKLTSSCSLLAVICMVFITLLIPQLSAGAVTTSSAPVSMISPSSQSQPTSVSQQQRQLQQQNLFALLKLSNMPAPQQSAQESKNVMSSERVKTKNLNHKKHRQYDDDYDDDGAESDIDFHVGEVLRTRGYVSDDGQQYQKAEKALMAAAAGTNSQSRQQHQIVNSNLSCPKECKCLNDYFDCNKNHLDRVPAMPLYVQSIDFIGNNLNDTTVLQLRNLPELSKLVLKRNQLDSMPIFVGLSSLKQLSLSHNRIRNISREALAALPNLKSLDLSKNYIFSLRANCFPSNNRIAHLLLNANKISSIEENAFQNLSELLNLEMNNNRLTVLPAGVFKNVMKLRKLSLSYNQLEINWSTFRGLTSLQKLFLKANNIRILQDGVFHVMRSIEMIDLDHNDISSLNRQGLFNLTKLHHLSLSNNSISHIELDTWEFTQSLISLDLSHNNISEFKPQHLDCLQRLKHLNLAHNKIQYLMENTFDCVKNLEDLNLRRNKLSWVIEDPGAVPPFKTLRKLKKLDLYGNNLKQINAKSLMGLTNLESLNLGSNALASIQSSAFDHMTHLQKLTFKSLNFICDCEILWFKLWLERHLLANGQQQQQNVPSLTSQALCGYPEHLLDRQLLSLQQNELTCAESPKPKLLQEPSNTLAVKESNITMECRATSPRAASFAATDELKIKWRHDNHNIKEQDRNMQPIVAQTSYTNTETQIHNDPSNNQTTIIGYLRLYNISYDAAGKYQCMVSNAFGTTYSQKFKISIGTYPSFLQIPTNLTIDSGDSARLVCSATGNPTPEIALQKFGSSDFPAATERRLQVLRDENAFVITNAKPIDSGIYTCTAESPAGDIKVNATLFVNDKPQPDIPIIKKEIVVGKSSVLECLNDAAADLNRPHRDWFKDNKPFHITPTLDTERYFFTPEKELLVIVNTQSMDAGRYRCEITDNSKTYTMLMELIVVKEDFSQNVIIIGVAVVTIACIIVGSLIVWIILFYQKKKLNQNGIQGCTINGGARIAAAQSHNALCLDQTQITTLNRTYLRSPRDHYHQRPRSLAALELSAGLYQPVEDENQPLTEQRSCVIVSTTPNYQQMLLQRNKNNDRHGRNEVMGDDEHLTLEYLRLNTSQDTDHQQDHLSSKDSGTGSDAANKRSLEDFCVTLIHNASTPNSTATLKSRGLASLSKQNIDDDDNYNDSAMQVNDIKISKPEMEMSTKVSESDDISISPTAGVSTYTLSTNDLTKNNNHLPVSAELSSANGAENCNDDNQTTSSLPILHEKCKTNPQDHTPSYSLPASQAVDI